MTFRSQTVCCTVLLAAISASTVRGDAEPIVEQAHKLTIERLYSLPSLIGTAPSGFAWSGNGRRLAFLWNDEGYNFRDVWMIDVEDPDLRPVRATSMPGEAGETPPDSEDPVAAAESKDRADRDRGVASVIWHPDNQRLLAGYRGDLWLVESGQEPINLTETEARESQAAFSPDGGTLAFLREGELWTLSVDADSAKATSGPVAVQRTRVTGTGIEPSNDPSARPTGRPDVTLSSFRWSSDGSKIAFLEADRRGVPLRSIPDYLTEEPMLHPIRRAYPGDESVRQRLGVLDAAAGSIEWIELDDPAPDMLLSYHWSPDSKRLAVDTSDLYAKARRIFVAELESGSTPGARVVAQDLDPRNETFYFWRIEWSIDGELLYFLSDREEDYHVWAVSASMRTAELPESKRLTRGSWAVAEMHPLDGGLIVVGNRDHAEERQLFRVGNDGGLAVRLSERAGTHSPTISPDGRYAAVHFSSDGTPPDLYLTALDETRSETQITRSPIAEFASYRWVTPEFVSFPSHVDGTRLHGRLTLPPDFDPAGTYPTILGSVYTGSVRNQWGGRTAHPTWGLDQFLAQEGYILLNVDMRGSWGRGREHRRGIRLDYGGMDIEDLESGVRFLETLGYVDMDHVGIWGSSYGGLMTTMSLFRKPGLYAAGIAGAPATNVWHALTGQMAVMMRPEDQPDEYADSSPFMHGHGLEDPLMIIHGMRDWVVLYKDSVTLVQRLIMLGKDVDLVTLPDSGHGWDNEGLAQTRFAFNKMVEFFDRHLKDACEECGEVRDDKN